MKTIAGIDFYRDPHERTGAYRTNGCRYLAAAGLVAAWPAENAGRRCIRCDATPGAHNDPTLWSCHQYDPRAPLWLRIRTKIAGWFL